MRNIIDSIEYIYIYAWKAIKTTLFYVSFVFCQCNILSYSWISKHTHNVHNESKDSSQAQNMTNIQEDCFLKISLYFRHRNTIKIKVNYKQKFSILNNSYLLEIVVVKSDRSLFQYIYSKKKKNKINLLFDHHQFLSVDWLNGFFCLSQMRDYKEIFFFSIDMSSKQLLVKIKSRSFLPIINSDATM